MNGLGGGQSGRNGRGGRNGSCEAAIEIHDDFLDHHLVRNVAREHGHVREGVGRIAFVQQAPQRSFGIGGLEERPVRPLADAPHEHVGFGLEPDRNAGSRDARARILGHEGPAARGEHLGAFDEQPRDHPAFAEPEFGLPVLGEDLGDRHARGILDLDVGIGEGQAEPLRQTPSDGTLAGSHHADEHDGAPGKAGPHSIQPLGRSFLPIRRLGHAPHVRSVSGIGPARSPSLHDPPGIFTRLPIIRLSQPSGSASFVA